MYTLSKVSDIGCGYQTFYFYFFYFFALVLVVVFGALVTWFGGTFYGPRWVVTVLEGLINVVLLSMLALWVRDDIFCPVV